MNDNQREIQRKLRVLEHADKIGSVARACRYFGVGRSSFYRWRDAYRRHGVSGLCNDKPVARNHPNRTPDEVIEKVLHLRHKYRLGPIRIVWYLERYHGIHVSGAGVYRILRRNGLNRLPHGTRLRKVHTKRYSKQVPGHHIQMDVKFLTFQGKQTRKIRRYQYTAIDDATRIRAMKIYERHNQASAIDFVDYVIDRFPFRIREIRTDNGHEFQAKFHWHVEDKGMSDDAIEEFETALKINPYYMKARLNLALALYDCGRYVEAQNHIERVLSIKPDNQLAKNLLNELRAVTDRK